FGSKLGNALVDGDGFGQKTIANENLCEAFKVVDGLKGFALADVELTDGHQGDLIARLILQNVLVFGDGLGDLALIQQLLCGFDVFAFVISHSRKETNLPREQSQTHSPGCPRAEHRPRSYSGNANRREKGKSTNPKFV